MIPLTPSNQRVAAPLMVRAESRGAELLPSAPARSFICTPDGTWIVVDPHLGSASRSTREEAEREIERRAGKPAVEPYSPWTVSRGGWW